MLKQVVRKGKVIYCPPPLKKIREFAQDNLAKLPLRYKKVYPHREYPVIISKGLSGLVKELTKNLKKRQ